MGAPSFTGAGLTPAPTSLLDSARKAAEQLSQLPAAGAAPRKGSTELEFDAAGARGSAAVSLGKGLTFGVAGEFGWAKTAQRRVSAVLKGAW
jgi:hypothetical protein